MQSALGTRLHLRLAHYPQTDGPTERTIGSLKDLLRACVLKQGCVWNDFLPLIGQYKDFCLVCELTQQSMGLSILKENNEFLVNTRKSWKWDVKLVNLFVVNDQSAQRKRDVARFVYACVICWSSKVEQWTTVGPLRLLDGCFDVM